VTLQAQKILKKEGALGVKGAISAAPLEESNFITIGATSPRPQDAAILANAYAKAFIQSQSQQLRREARETLKTARDQLAALGTGLEAEVQRQGLEEKIQTLQLIASQRQSAGIRQVEPAVPVATPINHNPKSNAIFAFVISLVLAGAAAFGLEYLNRKLTTVEAVEDTYELPVLTEVPKVDSPAPFGEGGIAMSRSLHEPFHRLQMNLDMLSRERPIRTILVASAAPGEGKSVVARNLALAYREAGRSVAILDADFRKATMGALLEAKQGPGLTDILSGRASFGQAVQEVELPPSTNGNGTSTNGAGLRTAPGPFHQGGTGELAMVPAGEHHGNLATALSSTEMRRTLETAADTYGTAIIDSPPLLAVADVLPLLSEADAVLIVTRLGVTTRDSARRLLTELRRVPDIRMVGVVVNGIPERTFRTRAYGYYYA
jgi:Mrp family chromosome partitioning ATPase